MKKTIAWFVLLAMMISVFASMAIAEETAEVEEILFRDIPWGSSPIEVEDFLRKSFPSAEFKYEIHTEYGGKSYQDLEDSGEYSFCAYSETVPMVICTVTGNFSVAGAKVNYIELRYIPKIAEDETSYALSNTDGELWFAAYHGIALSHTQLDDKLTALYGAPLKRQMIGTHFVTDYWQKGCTYVEVTGSAVPSVCYNSQYAYPDLTTKLKKLWQELSQKENNAQREQEMQTNSANTDGL